MSHDLLVQMAYHACMVFHTNPCKFRNFQNCHEILRGSNLLLIHNRRFEHAQGKDLTTFYIKNFRIYKDLYGKPFKRDWVARVVFLIQILLIFAGRYNR